MLKKEFLTAVKRHGCSIIFINQSRQILLFLRDDTPEIPYPNMWDVPGGHVEKNETPEECIVREMEEEMGLTLKGFHPFSVTEFPDRIEHMFWKRIQLDIKKIQLTEGQRLRWFSREEIERTELACGFNGILASFFDEAPFEQKRQKKER